MEISFNVFDSFRSFQLPIELGSSSLEGGIQVLHDKTSLLIIYRCFLPSLLSARTKILQGPRFLYHLPQFLGLLSSAWHVHAISVPP